MAGDEMSDSENSGIQILKLQMMFWLEEMADEIQDGDEASNSQSDAKSGIPAAILKAIRKKCAICRAQNG